MENNLEKNELNDLYEKVTENIINNISEIESIISEFERVSKQMIKEILEVKYSDREITEEEINNVFKQLKEVRRKQLEHVQNEL